MLEFKSSFTITVFLMTVLFLIWRPAKWNEAIPASIGALLLIMAGIVPLSNLADILDHVSGPSITILSTIIMSIVLESIGFFNWAAVNVVRFAKGSGLRLFWYILLMCFLMTMFFNNDGSILITTPIIIKIVHLPNLKPHQKIPYLFSGALVATAASAPIGVSNLANLIALEIVGLDLNSYTLLMFPPSMIGILVMALLLFLQFQKSIPRRITVFLYPSQRPFKPEIPHAYYNVKTVERWIQRSDINHPVNYHPLLDPNTNEETTNPWSLFLVCISLVVLTRASFFLAADAGLPIEWFAVAGASLLIAIRWYAARISPTDLLKKTPWSVILFAFAIYVVVYSLHLINLTDTLSHWMRELIVSSPFLAVMLPGLALTVMSNLVNNLPSVMLGTLTLNGVMLDEKTLQLAYLANIIGSDIGALITPLGTLASLIWLFILRRNKIPFSWKQYLKITIWIIPITLIVTLFSLYVWTQWIYF